MAHKLGGQLRTIVPHEVKIELSDLTVHYADAAHGPQKDDVRLPLAQVFMYLVSMTLFVVSLAICLPCASWNPSGHFQVLSLCIGACDIVTADPIQRCLAGNRWYSSAASSLWNARSSHSDQGNRIILTCSHSYLVCCDCLVFRPMY